MSQAIRVEPGAYCEPTPEMVDYLMGLSTGEIEPSDPHHGLCVNFGNECFSTRFSVAIHFDFSLWPEFSGNSQYPVPHPNKCPAAGYISTNFHWKKDEYGDTRRRLCAWCADQIELYLAEQEKSA